LAKGGQILPSGSEFWREDQDGAFLQKTYRESGKDARLGIVLAEPIDRKVYDFDFTNVALP
jgi:hypothetical protein